MARLAARNERQRIVQQFSERSGRAQYIDNKEATLQLPVQTNRANDFLEENDRLQRELAVSTANGRQPAKRSVHASVPSLVMTLSGSGLPRTGLITHTLIYLVYEQVLTLHFIIAQRDSGTQEGVLVDVIGSPSIGLHSTLQVGRAPLAPCNHLLINLSSIASPNQSSSVSTEPLIDFSSGHPTIGDQRN